MVSIEKLKKANELSKELRKHGFANDNSDAYSQAEHIVDRKKRSPEIEISEGEQVLVQENHEETIDELRSEIHKLERAREFSERKLYEHQEELANLIDKMNEMIKSINLIELNQVNFEKKLISEKKTVSPEPVAPVEVPVTPSTPPEQEATPDNSKELKEPIDRNGTAPADVAVEKIFYFGNK